MKTLASRFFIAILGFAALGSIIAAELPPAEPVKSISPAYDRYLEVVAQTKQLREAGDTEGLEALAAELRTSKEALDGGTWLLSHFYGTATRFERAEPEATEAMTFYESWARERPENITAQVSLAMALTQYAWTARGSGWAKEVTPEGWRLMEERLDRAWEILDRAAELEESCPGWYEAGQSVALGQGWDRDVYFEFVNEAIALQPTYGRYFTNTCYWLLPRWHGEVGDFEAWISEQADAEPTEKQDWQYARLVWMANMMPVKNQLVFEEGRLDWERTKRGFETWLATDPENLNVRFQFTQQALLAGDRETARAQFEVTGGKYFPGMWKDVEQFEQARRFAYEGGVNPLAAKQTASEPRFEIPPQVMSLIEVGLRVTSGFLGGALAGLCLLVLSLQRRQTAAGVVALLACVVAGTAFGTLATLVPAAVFYLFLRRKNLIHPPEISPPSGWIVLVWVVGLAVAFLALQMGAVVLTLILPVLEAGGDLSDDAFNTFMRDGTVFRQITMAGWLCLLGLLIACGPQNREGWQQRLGLHSLQWMPSILWAFGIGAAVLSVGYLADGFMDETTREALTMISEGIHSPFWFFFAISVVAPLHEELLFRGYAYSGWVKKLGVWGAILVPAVLFTACHIQYGWVGLLYIFLMGVALGILRWKTGSIYPCIALHMINNLLHCVEVAMKA